MAYETYTFSCLILKFYDERKFHYDRICITKSNNLAEERHKIPSYAALVVKCSAN